MPIYRIGGVALGGSTGTKFARLPGGGTHVIHQHLLRKPGGGVRRPRQSPPTARLRVRKNGLSKTHFHPGFRSARVRFTYMVWSINKVT
jgi:hypothetical protein